MIKKFVKTIYRLFFCRKYYSFGINSIIHKPLIIKNKQCISIGKNVYIQANARIEPVIMWENKQYFSPEVIIEDNVCIAQGLHLTCAGKVHIHKNCLLTPYVMITDINHEYKNIDIPVVKQQLNIKETDIGEGCFIGCGARIMPGVHLGKHCVVGANAVVTKNFPDYCVIAGIPAVCIKRYDEQNKEWKKTDKTGKFI